MTLDEGLIKYESHWTPGPATHVKAARELYGFSLTEASGDLSS